MKSNIALIGYMGTGKTAVGRVLAQKLGKEFYELDCLIEDKAGKAIPEIFKQNGEIGFRELEIEVVKEVSRKKDAVFACGGGVVLNQINIDRLKQDSVIVYLTALPTTILKRVTADSTDRPLLKTPDKARRIREMLHFRKPFYERAADIQIDTTKLDVDGVAEEIVARLRENQGV